MKSTNTASKKNKVTANQALSEQYKSQSSRGSSGEVKPKESIMMQNMKEFKCQIDHQIAKCLDTLDRQGLKFLKETLRASTLFGLNTQELANTQTLYQNIAENDEPSPPKAQIIKKIEPIRHNTQNNIQIKKVNKPQIPKKNPVTAKKVQVADQKNNLAQKIHKKLQNLNIKTGKHTETKKQNPKKNNQQSKKILTAPSPQIVEQICVQQIEQQQTNSPLIKQEYNARNVNRVSKTEQKQNTQKQYPSIQKKQVYFNTEVQQKSQNANLKPFYKNPFKKQEQNKPSLIESKKDEHLSANQNIKKQTTITSTERQQFLEDHKLQQPPYNKKDMQENKEQQIDLQLENLISKINKLSPNKRLKLQKIIEKLQDSKKDDVSISMISQHKSNEGSYLKPFVPQRGSFLKKSEAKQLNKSRSKLQKQQKATSLQNSIVRKINHNATTPDHNSKTQNESKMEESIKESAKAEQNGTRVHTLNQINAVSQLMTDQKLRILHQAKSQQKQSLVQDLKNSSTFKSKQSQFANSMSESGQKFIKIIKKKTVSNTFSIHILSNNGHPTLAGLLAIKLFNENSQIIPIDESNIKSNQKALKLFSQNPTQGWYTSLPNPILTIESINQSIAAIRIINLNKSQLQNNKQANLVEIFINNQLFWRGNLKGGSFKQHQVYLTDITFPGKKIQLPPHKITTDISQQQLLSKRLNAGPNRQTQIPEKGKNSNLWLEQQTVDKKMKELAQMEQSEHQIKRIQSIRGSSANLSILKQQNEPPKSIKQQYTLPNDYGLKNIQKLPSKTQLRAFDNDDIIGLLNKQIDNKKKMPSKESSASQYKKRQQQYLLIQKQKSQDEQFDKILMIMEQREKKKEEPIIKEQQNTPQNNNNKKSLAEKSLSDFMNDSLFDDKPKMKRIDTSQFRKQFKQKKIEDYPKNYPEQKKGAIKEVKDIDNFIDQLNDMIGGECQEETGEQFYIPELPKGSELSLNLLSNWGNQSFIGLNGIQIFDSSGNTIRPIDVSSAAVNNRQLYDKLFKAEFLTSDQKVQLKIAKNKKTAFVFRFSQKIELAAIRIWNYNGHRVHNNIGVKKCHIKLDEKYIFSGEIQQSSGSSEGAYKNCEYILFTENSIVLKKIKDKDWLSKIKIKEEEQNILFKTTLQNFHRPTTKNDEQNIKKSIYQQIQRQPIKLPKKQCFQYDPPLMPEGFILKFAIHSSWGDRFFIGLNGIQIFNEKGQDITNNGLVYIKADPSSISKLEGYDRDKRVISNLINGKNNTTSNDNIWLAPLLSDVEKMEKGRANTIIMEYKKTNKISGINFYNYAKTPERGVRQLQIYLDNYLLYRGYLRKYNLGQPIVHTSINFTKEQSLLEAMSYIGYNEDHLEQEVSLTNEQKIIRSVKPQSSQKQIYRPMTGRNNN